MTRQQWYPKADRTTQTYDVTGRQMRTVNMFVLHTTEGVSFPTYNNNFPTFTYDPATHVMRQHIPVDFAAKGLVSGTIRTNWNNCAQIEIIGTSGWNAALAAIGWHVKDMDDQAIKDLADLLLWLSVEWEVPLNALSPWSHPRLTDNEYLNFYGILGHMHVPYNDHGDPGNEMPIGKILAIVQSSTAPVQVPSDNNQEEDIMYALKGETRVLIVDEVARQVTVIDDAETVNNIMVPVRGSGNDRQLDVTRAALVNSGYGLGKPGVLLSQGFTAQDIANAIPADLGQQVFDLLKEQFNK